MFLSAEKSSVKLRPRVSGQILGVQSLQLGQFLSDPEIRRENNLVLFAHPALLPLNDVLLLGCLQVS